MRETIINWMGSAFLFGIAFYTAKAWITELFWPWWKRKHSGYVADMTSPPVTTAKGNLHLPHLPFKKNWQEIFNELPEDCEVKLITQEQINKQRPAVMEYLFFAYYGPLESWCERNLQGSYYLWYDDKRINMILFEERDRVLWLLKWGNGFPSYAKLDKAT
jgi:hypothetical protein